MKIKTPYWSSKPVFIIGGGPSLKGFNFERLRGRGYVLAINKAVFEPGCRDVADGVCSMDARFALEWEKDLIEFEGDIFFAMRKTNSLWGRIPRATYLETIDEGLALDPTRLRGRGNSGMTALNVCLLKKARVVYLLGYDMNTDTVGHWHGGYGQEDKRAGYYHKWGNQFNEFQPILRRHKCTVVNLNPESAVNCFMKMPLDDVIPPIEEPDAALRLVWPTNWRVNE